jgi:DNA replication licensing factor MCM6
MTRHAQELLVECYKDLRADDAQGVGRNSYRITVRQLESMIRLSEAVARANCVNEITPAFVKEAFNLLKQSIIHVEKDDVEVEDDDEEEPEEAHEEAPVEAVDVKKEKTKIQYDKYVHMMNLIIRRLDEDERSGGQGIERDELVMWYLEQAEDEIATEEQHHEEAQLVRKVLKRLKKVSPAKRKADGQDNYIMEVRGEVDDDEMEVEGPKKIVYVLHPNCNVENFGVAAGAETQVVE